MKKRNTILYLLLFATITSAYFLGKGEKYVKNQITKKAEEKIMQEERLTPEVLVKDISGALGLNSRAPSSIMVPKKKKTINKSYQVGGKAIQGPQAEKYSKGDKKLNFLNSYNPKWEDKLFTRILKFQDKDTVATIDKISSYIYVSKKGARHMEIVKIKMTAPDGHSSFYKAKIDAGSGKIIKTWDRTHVCLNHKTDNISLNDSYND